MKLDTTNLLLVLLGVILVLCFILMLTDKKQQTEGFDPVIDAIQSQIQNENPEQLKQTIQTLQQRLINYGYAPDINQYVKKTELGPYDGKCTVSTAEDRDKYIPKTDVPAPGPRIDLSQYVKKSSIPPEKVCPPAPTVDLSAYVKKSTLPPNEKCPPCIAPKVKVSAGLCRECPPPPPCPAPEPCPACNCPPPTPCPAVKEKKCDEIRYIKVPAVITKTITVDKDGNVLSQKIDSGSTHTTAPITTAHQELTPTTATTKSLSNTLMSSIFGPSTVITTALEPTLPKVETPELTIQSPTKVVEATVQQPQMMPSTTFPTISIANTNLAQTLAGNGASCVNPNINSQFSAYDSGRVRARNESNFKIYA